MPSARESVIRWVEEEGGASSWVRNDSFVVFAVDEMGLVQLILNAAPRGT